VKNTSDFRKREKKRENEKTLGVKTERFFEAQCKLIILAWNNPAVVSLSVFFVNPLSKKTGLVFWTCVKSDRQ
jgi:hypothetical protein